MQLSMILLVRDEVDIIQENIEFHLNSGVDFIVAINNGSIDGTREILQQYEQIGQAIVFDEPEHNFVQSKWVTNAAEYAREVIGADWIFSSDADEFWKVPIGQLKTELENTNADVLEFKRVNMFYPWDDDSPIHWSEKLRYHVMVPEAYPQLNDRYNSSFPSPFVYWKLPPKVMFRSDSFKTIHGGNHSIEAAREVVKVELDGEILHFPFRSTKQFSQKICQGGAALERNTEIPENFGWQWRRWFRIIKKHSVETALREILPSNEQLLHDLKNDRVLCSKQGLT
jgi:glycosyltransferase involved in cell wall biosynthesis